MQGRLRNEYIAAEIVTVCAHCGKAMEIRSDSELRWELKTPGAKPLIFEPDIDWSRFGKSNIIEDY